MLELLSDIGKSQGLEEARHLVEGARSLRMDVLDTLLTHLKRIKVARLAWPTRWPMSWVFLGLTWHAATANVSVEAPDGCRPQRPASAST